MAEPRHNKGFTLAEVLITLTIIGVVAALTIPTLVQNYQERAWKTSSEVFEIKLEDALKTMNTQQTLAGYNTTEDFVKELSNHFKMDKICNNDDLLTCFSDKVFWGADKEEIDMAKVKTAKDFGQDKWNTDIVGVQFDNGVTGLIAYNPECRQNPYSNQITGTSCLAILYDTDGFKNPNTSNKDLRSINFSKLGRGCYAEIDGICFTGNMFAATDYLTIEECEAQKNDLGIKECNSWGENDYWAWAVKQCKQQGGRLPTMAEIAKITNYIYNTSGIGDTESVYNQNLKLDYNKAAIIGFNKENLPSLWSGDETGHNTAYMRSFGDSYTHAETWYRDDNFLYAICVTD